MSISPAFGSNLKFGHVPTRAPVKIDESHMASYLEDAGRKPQLGQMGDQFLPRVNKHITPGPPATRQRNFTLPALLGPLSLSSAILEHLDDPRAAASREMLKRQLRVDIPVTRRRVLQGAGALATIFAVNQVTKGGLLRPSPAAAATYKPQLIVPQSYKGEAIESFHNWNQGGIATPWKTGVLDWIPNVVKNANPADYTSANVQIGDKGFLNYFGPWNSLSPYGDDYFEYKEDGGAGGTPGHFANTTYSNVGTPGQFLYIYLNGQNTQASTIGTDYLTWPVGNPDGKVSALSYRFKIPSLNFPELHILAKLGADSPSVKPDEIWIVVSDPATGAIVKGKDGQQLKFKVKLRGNNKPEIDNISQYYFRFHPDTVFLTEGKDYEVTFYAPTIKEGQKIQVRTRVYGEWPEDNNPITTTS